MDSLDAMDKWCVERLAALKLRQAPFLKGRYDLNHPEYRRLGGQQQAFLQMRSFIHGCLKAKDT